jgi:polyisoprenyl-teichoic acid--peptidoglycan teichoic acid transferase
VRTRSARGIHKRFLIGSAVVVGLTTIAVAATVLLEVWHLSDIVNKGHTLSLGSGDITAPEAGSPQTIMILGSDHRKQDQPGDRPHSDTILLMRLDPGHPATTLMSIPRDLKVDVPGLGTTKINQAYYAGGPKLALRTVKRLLSTPGHPFQVNHIVDINFRGFRRAVDYVGCVYVAVDRRYFNPEGTGYAAIDIQPGYQRLCGEDALAYARYRHGDNDIVRGARQQDFLRQAKAQISAKSIFDKRDRLLEVFSVYAQTDKSLHDPHALLDLGQLAAFSAGHPVREVRFPAIVPDSPTAAYVGYSRSRLPAAVDEFLSGKAKAASSHPSRRRSSSSHRRSRPAPLDNAATQGQDQAIVAAQGTRFPVYYPTKIAPGSQYQGGGRAYRIRDLKGGKHRAYAMVVQMPGVGEYYDVQGMNWTDPPILAKPDEQRTIAGRQYSIFYDGGHIRLVAFRAGNAVYWITNTLTRALSNKQMLGIAQSMRR